MLVVVGGVVPVVVARHFGALGIPRNDDWSYLRAAFTLGEDGRLDGNDWVTVSLVGQLLLALPVVWTFGARITPLQIEVVVIGVVGLVATYDVARAVVGARRALFVALLVAVGPLWAPLAVSFMTDVPSFAFAMVALACGVRAFRPPAIRRGWFVAAIVAAVFAGSIRDSAIVLVAVLLLVGVWCAGREGATDRRFVVVVSVIACVGFAVFWWWKSGLPGFGPDASLRPEAADARAALRRLQGLVVTVGLCAAPAVALAGPVALVRRSWARAPITTALVAVGTAAAVGQYFRSTGNLTGPGNYIARTGTLAASLLPGARPDLLSPRMYAVVGAVGFLGAVVLTVAAVGPGADGLARLRRGRLPPPASPALALVTTGALALSGFMLLSRVLGNALWDRYVLLIVPLVAIAVLAAGDAARDAGPVGARSSTPRRASAVAVLVGLAALGGVYGANSASYDGTRRDVAESAARALGSRRAVDGGFEWNGEQAGREAYFSGRPAQPCVVVVSRRSAPRAGDHHVVAAAEVWSATGRGGWIVARSTGRCDPAP